MANTTRTPRNLPNSDAPPPAPPGNGTVDKAKREALQASLKGFRSTRSETAPGPERDNLKAQVREVLSELRAMRADQERGREPIPVVEETMAEELAELREETKFLSATAELTKANDTVITANRAKIEKMASELGTLAAIRVATPRLNNVLQTLDLLGNVASGNYKMPPEAVEYIFGARDPATGNWIGGLLHEKVSDIAGLFSVGKSKSVDISLNRFAPKG